MRNSIILGGIGLVVLVQSLRYFEVTRTDPVFWYAYVPFAVAVGFLIGRVRGASSDITSKPTQESHDD